ncbi:MAG TPA: extracellular solute-binding protein [Alphaproteobacteria bacterium]|jgi:ABC-type Fe3+ transport system substrate-binding protein
MLNPFAAGVRLSRAASVAATFGLLAGSLVAGSLLAASSAHAQGAPAARPAPSQFARTWDETLAAAKKEGKLVVAGPSGKLWQDLLETFRKDYPDIKIQVTSFAGRDFWPRAVKEREVGQYLWDIRVGGAETQAFKLIESGGLAPVRDMYMSPEVADEANWYGGFNGMFLDYAKKYMPAFCAFDSPLVYTNEDFIKPGQITTFTDIVKPEWKGKIAMADPRGGSTIVSMGAIYKVFGPDFIKKLIVDQKPVVTQNTRQLVQWFAQGTYPIGMGMPTADVLRFQESGVNLKMGKVSGLDTWSAGVCGLQVLEPRPNPNATVVFVNWILSQAVQEKIMKATQLNSRRRGVPFGDPDRALDMEHIDKYMGTQTQEFEEPMASAKELIRNLMQ